MLIKFSKHGTGNAFKACTYLMQSRDWTGSPRKEVKVIRGDPELVAEKAEALKFVHRYTSGVIAWSPEDDPSGEEIEEVIEEFERTAFAGLSPERYLWSAVLHKDDKGGVHVHVYAARVELLTGKSLNIAPPGWQKTFDELCRYFNYRKGWARPDDPARARIFRQGYTAYLEAGMLRQGLEYEPEPRQLINSYIVQKIQSGLILDRSDIVQALSEAGFEITRAGKKYITAKDPDSGKKWRLTGAIYDQKFNVHSYLQSEESDSSGAEGSRGIDEQKAETAFRKLQQKRRKRAEHNQRVYGGHKGKARGDEQVKPGTDQYDGSGPGKMHKPEQKSGQDVDDTGSDVFVDLHGYLSGQLGAEYIFSQGHKHADRKIPKPEAGNQQSGTNTGPSQLRNLGSETSPDKRWEIFNFAPGHGPGKYLENRREGCFEALRQLGGEHDRTGDKIKRDIDQSFQAIRAGSEAACKAGQGLAAASRSIERTAEEADRVFRKNRPVFEKRIRALISNIRQKLESSKQDISF